jgi:hypothetical protein
MEEIEKLEDKSNHGGRREGSGRKPGVPNKLSLTVKENIIEVFNQLGGVEHMKVWASDNPNQFYAIYAKLMPTQTEISGTDGSPLPLSIGISFVEPTSTISEET